MRCAARHDSTSSLFPAMCCSSPHAAWVLAFWQRWCYDILVESNCCFELSTCRLSYFQTKQCPDVTAVGQCLTATSPSIVGAFSGLCSVMGLVATFISRSLVKIVGILKAGAAGLIFQASLLPIALTVYWAGSISQRTPLPIFLASIALCRLGHMSYDVVGTQIIQTGVPASKANLIGGMKVSIASLAELVCLRWL